MLIKNFTAKFPFLIMWMIITRLTEQAILIFCVAAEQLISPLKSPESYHRFFDAFLGNQSVNPLKFVWY